MALSRVFGLRRARLGANAPSLVGIPTVVAHELEPLGMCWVTAAMKSVGESAAKLPPCFLFMRER